MHKGATLCQCSAELNGATLCKVAPRRKQLHYDRYIPLRARYPSSSSRFPWLFLAGLEHMTFLFLAALYK
jgi:hypothetical protein